MAAMHASTSAKAIEASTRRVDFLILLPFLYKDGAL
jgi:hypothetical protein